MKQLLFALVAAVCLPLSVAHAQLSVPAEHQVFRKFLLDAYPELAGRALQIQHNGDVSAQDVVLFELLPSSTIEATRNTLIHAHIEFSSQHQLTRYAATGPLLHDADNSALAHAIQLATTPAAVTNEIARRALPFGPNQQDAVLTKLNQLHLDNSIGPSGVLSASSAVRANDSHFGFLWSVEVQASRDGDVTRRYLLTFEPFGGDLVGLTER